ESADELDVEMAHVEETAAGFTREGECRGDGRLESGLKKIFVILFGRDGGLEGHFDFGLLRGKAKLKLVEQNGVEFMPNRIALPENGLKFLDVAFVLRADEAGKNAVHYLGCIHERFAVS